MRKPVCITLADETIFAETNSEVDDEGMISVVFPFSVAVVNNSIILKPWIAFSDQTEYKIPSDKLVNIASLDSLHKSIYASVILGIRKNQILSKLERDVISKNVSLVDYVDDMYEEMVRVCLMYDVPEPKYDDIRAGYIQILNDKIPQEYTSIN